MNDGRIVKTELVAVQKAAEEKVRKETEYERRLAEEQRLHSTIGRRSSPEHEAAEGSKNSSDSPCL